MSDRFVEHMRLERLRLNALHGAADKITARFRLELLDSDRNLILNEIESVYILAFQAGVDAQKETAGEDATISANVTRHAALIDKIEDASSTIAEAADRLKRLVEAH